MAKHFLVFNYNDRGRGELELHNNSLVEYAIKARTGSINKKGELVNAIYPGEWTIHKHSVDTTEESMEWENGKGWKVRMWTPSGQWSRYLIHPDGGKSRGNGTKGCIGLQGSGTGLRNDIDKILFRQETIKVYINQEV